MRLFKSLGFFVVLGVFFIFVSPFALGVSIQPAKYSINFEPNLEKDFGFYICGAAKIETYLDGDLVKYATIIDNEPNSSCRDIVVRVRLPNKIEKPGKNILLVGAKELIEVGSGVAGRAAIQAPIVIFVPYPGMYVEWNFVAPNVNEGETVHFIVSVSNLGTNNIQSARAIIDVYDDNSKIKSLNTDEKSIPSKESAEFPLDMETTGMKAGSYRVVTTLYYDGRSDLKEKSFNIGSLYVAINNYTKVLEQGKINKVGIEIESKWNNNLQDVYSAVTINGVKVKTPNYDLKAWETKEIAAYYDTTGMDIGEYDAQITLYYGGKTTTEEGKVYVVEQSEVQSSEAKEEKPWNISFNITPTTLLVAIIIILVVVDIVWLIIRRKNKR